MTKEIKINWKDEIFTVLVDDDSHSLLARHTWYIMFSGKGRLPYAFAEIYSKTQGKRMLYMHQIVTGSYSTTDHINGNTLDNQHHNLRSATAQENGWNKGKPSGGRYGKASSQYKGVTRLVGRDGGVYYRVIIKTTKKGVVPAQFIRMGPFSSEIEAAEAYNREVVKLRGDFAWVNPIPQVA